MYLSQFKIIEAVCDLRDWEEMFSASYELFVALIRSIALSRAFIAKYFQKNPKYVFDDFAQDKAKKLNIQLASFTIGEIF